MFEKNPDTNPTSVSLILKSLLSGNTIETSQGVFKYYRKGDWISISEDEEGEISEEGIFKRCEVIHNRRRITDIKQEAIAEHRWLLWLTSIADFVKWAESVSPAELAVITSNLVLQQIK